MTTTTAPLTTSAIAAAFNRPGRRPSRVITTQTDSHLTVHALGDWTVTVVLYPGDAAHLQMYVPGNPQPVRQCTLGGASGHLVAAVVNAMMDEDVDA